MRIFLSWSGDSKKIAEQFKEYFSMYFRNTEFYISTEMEKGALWFENLAKELESTKYGIIFLTKKNIEKPWLYFEAGAISKSIGSSRVTPFLFNVSSDELLAPLNQFQCTEFKKDDVLKLLKTINDLEGSNQLDMHQFERNFSNHIWHSFEEELSELQKNEFNLKEIHENKTLYNSVIEKLENNSGAIGNVYFRTLIIEYIKENKLTLENIKMNSPAINLPYILYPKYLIRLMKDHSATVKAIAIVDKDEFFWTGKIGYEIFLNTTPNSTRVFVFTDYNHMKKHISILKQHSGKYNVYVLSCDNLTKEFPEHVYDFSIIGDIGMRLLARYNDSNAPKTIEFLTEREQISKHEDELLKIINIAVEMPKKFENENEDEFIEKVFYKREPIDRRPIEMSKYIQIDDYDEYEEQHAYYIEMMERMVEICLQKRGNAERRIKIIEFGAGTGIFTKRLAKIKNSEIKAIELDWMCFNKLKHKCINKLRNINPNIEYINVDSRSYTLKPEEDKADFVFSSFADHHIKPYDKEEYFLNIKRNLKPNGLFIVGDEFLPAYDKNVVESRRNALKMFHNHIIDIATEKNQLELIRLEKDALESGLEEFGDFKLSCEEYESLLNKSNLNFTFEKEKIGPSGRNDLGGVYVYTIHL